MHQVHNSRPTRDRRLANMILVTIAMLVLIVAFWSTVARALFPEQAVPADCEAQLFFAIDGVSSDKLGETYHEDFVAPQIDLCVDERLGR